MDSLNDVRKSWDCFAEERPYWAVLTTSDWTEKDPFYKSGQNDVDEILREAKSCGIEISQGKAIDFGCGLGRLTYPLCGYFDEVLALDISARMIEQAKHHEKCPKNAVFQVLQTSDLKLVSSNSYDFILSLIVLQHMPKRFMKAYIQEFARVCKPGGTIVFQVPVHRDKIETPKDTLWKDKPLLSGNPRLPRLCYRCIFRSARWTIRTIRRKLWSNEIKYRLECAWMRMTGKTIMQMNTLSHKEINRLLKSCSCEAVHKRQDERGGDGYTSYLYFITKKS
ncbi:class I SAM-dependent methyltransferase [Pelagicoccus enzymogenes]|uniref:class I SAM-dependent methyltransferase n=1 Tax=Pelagicoccus enzymogenes TaxID=2773457 RepID=UPI0028100614|nr:class I SAM-dependent methyltransferase [Pelagicoccus enzymogenes]MDQ8197452.1 class I SAM-dependent methyltransferase [Pelagicoccus enzymogenes]